MGRASSFTQETADEICERIAGGESLRTICLDDHLPDDSTVLRWLGKPEHENFRDQYAHAREIATDAMAEDILDIADDGTNDYVSGKDGAEVLNAEHIQRSKLRVDTRKWLMARLRPKKYGDRVTQEITGKDGAPLAATINVTVGIKPPSLPEATQGTDDDGD